MNQLRQLMLEELQRRNFAATSIRTYLHGVAHFSLYFRRPPDQLGPEDIRKYQAMLFSKLKYGPKTVILRLASLRFFYIHVLKRNWSIAETPYPLETNAFNRDYSAVIRPNSASLNWTAFGLSQKHHADFLLC